MPFPGNRHKKIHVLAGIMAGILVLYSVRLLSLQVLSADRYASQASGVSTRVAVLKAPRGEILDCYGRKIAVNRDGYNIVFNSAYLEKSTLNDLILTLCRYLESMEVEWNDKLPLSQTAPYSFTESDNAAFLSRIGLAHYATAENAASKLIDKYKLTDYSEADRRLIMGVRYTMEASDFSIANPFTLAEDVPEEVMQRVSEGGFLLKGVSVDVVPFREYVQTDLAPQIIGSVGLIDAEMWYGDEKKGIVGYKDKGYSFNDKVGKSGIEAYAEEDLRGDDGEITYYLNADGTIVDSKITKEPIAGKTVLLTLDKSVQSRTQAALAETVESLKASNGTVTGGAAVVRSVSSGAVIASANYPTYDAATLSENYNELLKDPSRPLLNRAFQGIYPIGSTIKPAVAVCGIDNGKLSPTETITCLHTYRLFPDYQPSCMGTHGSITLNTALARSCNYFFFEVGRRVGATLMTDYFRQFGLGVPTGVEVGDSAGLLADVAEGSGDTLQISIGQKNAFTPLQLAGYTATLANGGTRYKTTLISRVMSYDLKETYRQGGKDVLGTLPISDTAWTAVKAGMLSVTEDGTGRTVFGNYPIKVGGKTGTAQTDSGADHSVFIAFAPFENPEIAVSVILEHGSNGFAAGTIVKEILDAYFFAGEVSVDSTPSYVVVE